MKEEIKKKVCDKKQQWSGEYTISGCEFVEVEQPDKHKQILRCKKCGTESVGVIN